MKRYLDTWRTRGTRGLVAMVAGTLVAIGIAAAVGSPATATDQGDAEALGPLQAALDSQSSVQTLRRRRPRGVRLWLAGLVGQGDPPSCLGRAASKPLPAVTFWTYDLVAEQSKRGDPFSEPTDGLPLDVANRVWVCLYGFAKSPAEPPVTLTITDPDGGVHRDTADRPSDSLNDGFATEARSHWIALPGHPTGVYRVEVEQGRRHATGSFTVGPASRPRLFVIDSAQRFVPVERQGRSFTVALAGVPPRARVALDIYRHQRGREDRRGAALFRWYDSRAVRVGSDGTRLYRFVGSREYPPGAYKIMLRGRTRIGSGGCFTIVRPGRPLSGSCASQ